MTVIELRELLSQYNDDVEVQIQVTDILDNYNFYVNGLATNIHLEEDNDYKITLVGSDVFS